MFTSTEVKYTTVRICKTSLLFSQYSFTFAYRFYHFHCLFLLLVLCLSLGVICLWAEVLLSIFGSIGPLLPNSLGFCLCENAFWLRFREYFHKSMEFSVGRVSFPFLFFSAVWRFPFLLASNISAEKPAISFVVTPSKVMGHFSLAVFRLFCLWFSAVWLGYSMLWSLCFDSLWGLLRLMNLWVDVNKSGEFSAIISPNIASTPFPVTSITPIFRLCSLSCSFLVDLFLHSFYCLASVLFFFLLTYLWALIVSSAVFILLLNP